MSSVPWSRGHRPGWPAGEHRRHTGFTPAGRVRWLNPAVLARTAVQVALSRTFGQFADRRELQKTERANPLDLTAARHDTAGHDGTSPGDEDFWLDFVADLGDGFDATATVASQLAADELTLAGPDGEILTRAGSLLVMGGDQVYPAASATAYNDRLVGPYRAMLPWAERPRWLVALPGNHDWYDGLVSFLRAFCQQRWIGGWKTVQSRSYFAVRLPGGWWLWGVDTQLADEIDKPQLDYFRAIAQQVGPDEAIILCWANPCWVDSGPADPEAYAAFEFFERTVVPDRAMVRVVLTGDLHHYARYAGPNGEQKITAGGGGAYLAATHHLPDQLLLPPEDSRDLAKRSPVEYRLRATYPSPEESRRRRYGVWRGIFGNRTLCAIPALLYGLLGFVIGQAFPGFGGADPWRVDAEQLVLAVLILAGTYYGLSAFTGLKKRPRAASRRLLGAVHTLAHLVTVLVVAAGLRLACVGLGFPPQWTAITLLGGCAVAGAVARLLVLAAHLLVADRVGVNTNELFAAQAIPDHKCFVRLRIASDGELTIYPVRIDRTVRWEFALDGGTAGDRRWYRPVGGVEPAAALIEPPIVVPRRAPGQTGPASQPPLQEART